MRKRWLIILGFLLVVLGPVIVKQLVPDEGRRMTGVPLDDLRYTEVSFKNTQEGLDLAGLLFVPEAAGPFPAVVVIHGSGTSRRNSRWYTTLVSDLLERGIAVLLPDKRGSEKSGGNWRTASFEALATDTVAAVDYLASRKDLPTRSIGLVGMSQGGWIAPVAAGLSDSIGFVVSFSGATVTPPQQLYYEEVRNLQQAGFLPGVAHALSLMSTTYIRYIGQREFWEKIEDFDPIPHWQAMTVEGLLVFGSNDTNVPTEESAARIRELNRPEIETRVFKGSGHAIADTPEMGTRIVRRDASEAVADFILEASAAR